MLSLDRRMKISRMTHKETQMADMLCSIGWEWVHEEIH